MVDRPLRGRKRRTVPKTIIQFRCESLKVVTALRLAEIGIVSAPSPGFWFAPSRCTKIALMPVHPSSPLQGALFPSLEAVGARTRRNVGAILIKIPSAAFWHFQPW